MAARQGIRKQQREPGDFVGDRCLKQRRMAAEPAAARRRSAGKTPVIPPPVEEAVLMAVAEQFPDLKYVSWAVRDENGRGTLVPFDWRNLEHWREFTLVRDLAAAALTQLTTLSDAEIGELVACSGPTVIKAARWYERLANVGSSSRGDRLWLGRLLDVLERTEEIADCALLWSVGVVVAQ
jgi:hypothetical protein